MKYKDLLNKYFNSEQFENSILQLKEEGESPEYINKYIIKAKNYIEFYIKGNKSYMIKMKKAILMMKNIVMMKYMKIYIIYPKAKY